MVDIMPTPNTGFVAPAHTVEPAVVAKPNVIEPAHTVEAVPNHVPPFVAGGTVVPASVGVDEPVAAHPSTVFNAGLAGSTNREVNTGINTVAATSSNPVVNQVGGSVGGPVGPSLTSSGQHLMGGSNGQARYNTAPGLTNADGVVGPGANLTGRFVAPAAQMVDRGDGVMVDIRTQTGNRPSPLPHGANPSGFSTLTDGQKGGINSAYNVLGAALRQAGVI